jgi:hypothetical protein
VGGSMVSDVPDQLPRSRTELMLLDRGVEVDHSTIFRWIQAYAAELEKRIRPHLRMSNGSGLSGHRGDHAALARAELASGPSIGWGDHEQSDTTDRVCCRLGTRGWNGRCVWLGLGLTVNLEAST